MKDKCYKILIPTDFSEISRGAVQYVLQHFKSQLTHLVLLHAYKENTPNSAPLISLVDILREKSERLMQQEIQTIRSMVGAEDIEILPISRFDGLIQAIAGIARETEIDLVAIGTNGHTHPKLDLRDDDPSVLLHRISRPILLVPKIAN